MSFDDAQRGIIDAYIVSASSRRLPRLTFNKCSGTPLLKLINYSAALALSTIYQPWSYECSRYMLCRSFDIFALMNASLSHAYAT